MRCVPGFCTLVCFERECVMRAVLDRVFASVLYVYVCVSRCVYVLSLLCTMFACSESWHEQWFIRILTTRERGCIEVYQNMLLER